MDRITVKHLYEVYKDRLEMQKKGITNPPQHIKDFTKLIVETLYQLPKDEIVEFVGKKLIDSRGNVIIVFPSKDD